jgi:hypothetical protein
MSALEARFRDHTLRLFKKHGITLVGIFTTTDDEHASDTLVYILAFESREAASEAWAAFLTDPEWIAVKSQSEADGKLVAQVASIYLSATDYSPLY